MNTKLKKSLMGKLAVISILFLLVGEGCSNVNNSSKTSDIPNTNENSESQVSSDTGNQKSNTDNPSSSQGNSSDTSSNSEANNPVPPVDPSKTLLMNIMQLAKQGKILNCQFPVKTTVIDTVEKQWGNPDKVDWVPAAKGNYATYSKHNVVFGFNKGDQIFEVRCFDSSIKKIRWSQVKAYYGKPAHDVIYNGDEIIGYVVTKEYKILMVFPKPTKRNPDPLMDHYSVFYPQGTVNSMADDPGREW